ncbi:MerR family transcriptional regulator [Litoreibacter sp.]|nr:MerR family transcriptional regulator [Litoreibacter sp.]
MADKAREAFRTISEVANWLDIPAHVLRFWESKFPQIKPVKRAGGRRYYRPADMRLIGGIKKLLHDDGLTIRGVQKMLKEDGVKAISELAPALDMPSEEEGAERRQARRARRQARQAGKQEPTKLAPEPTPVEEDVAEAPFTHVEDTPLGGDNVVSLMSDHEEPATEEEDLTSAAVEADISDDAADGEPATDEQDVIDEVAEPDLQEDVSPSVEPEPEREADTNTDALQGAEQAPTSTIPEPQDTLPEASELAVDVKTDETPQPDIPADPDPASITLSKVQETTVARVKRLRRGNLADADTPEDAQLKRAALDRLTDLRARMASKLG